MKLKNLVPQRYHKQVVQRFGDAKLVRLANGGHELLGGSDAERTAAFEWASLFAHEIVFTHFHLSPKCHLPFPGRHVKADALHGTCAL
jgi:hypothetical protein